MCNPPVRSFAWLLLGNLFLFSSLFAQPLDWTYENIVTDLQESGANPDLVQDQQGNLHLTYWKVDEDRLVYGVRTPATSQWNFEEVPDQGSFGYASSLAIDPSGNPHIAYLHRDAGDATLKYATKENGIWIIDPAFGSEAIGVYGVDQAFPSYVQPSLDVFFQPDGRPGIMFFHGRIGNIVACSPVDRTYINYELNLNLLLQQPDGSWFHEPFEDVPYEGTVNCLTQSDRFGEFCKVLPRPGNNYLTLTNALHNHDLLMFESVPGTLLDWDRTKLDSTQRVYATVSATHFREGFAFIDGEITNDSLLHLVYRVAHIYGNGSLFNSRQHMFYTRINLNQLGDSAYTPFHHSFLPISTFRSHFSLSAADDDRIFISYYDNEEQNVVVTQTTDGGLNWEADSIYEAFTNAGLKTELTGDSLYLLAYDAAKDILRLSAKDTADSTWLHQQITRSENRGESLSSQVERVGNDDQVFVAFTEGLEDQLVLGERIQDTWTYQAVDSAGRMVREVSMILDEQNNPCLTYVFEASNSLRFAYRDGGTWAYETIATEVEARDITIQSFQDSLYVSFYDVAVGDLKYARGTLGGNWSVAVIDSSSLIVGQRPDLALDEQGGLHISYIDPFLSELKYAHRPQGGSWNIEEVTQPNAQNPTISSIKIDSTGTPFIAYRDAGSDSIFLAKKGVTEWEIESVIGETINLVGIPLRLILDEKDRPWILYNYSGVQNEVRLARKDEAGEWFSVSVNNNEGEIANEFDFHLVEKDFYVIGKKNRTGNRGLGLLFAEGGVSTSIEDGFAAAKVQVFPNPSSGMLHLRVENQQAHTISLALYNLQGQQVHLVSDQMSIRSGTQEYQWDLSHLPDGMYVLHLQGLQTNQFVKWLKMK
ncbi:MAG: T9SS type A sorting domain-containing protein [Bacteroidota bacterium]